MSFGQMMKKVKQGESLLATPYFLDYLTKNGGNVKHDEAIVEIIADLIRDDSNSIRHSRFGASSRGQCLRRQVFAFLGKPTLRSYDPILHNIFMDGTWRHMRWQAMGLQCGAFTDVEVMYQKGNFKISLDAENEDEEWIFELKGARFVPEEVPEAHMLQIHTYFWASGYDKCSYLVEDKRSQDWKEFVVTPVQKYVEAVEEEIEDLENAVKLQVLPEILPACRQKEGPFKKCPYSEICLDEKGWKKG